MIGTKESDIGPSAEEREGFIEWWKHIASVREALSALPNRDYVPAAAALSSVVDSVWPYGESEGACDQCQTPFFGVDYTTDFMKSCGDIYLCADCFHADLNGVGEV